MIISFIIYRQHESFRMNSQIVIYKYLEKLNNMYNFANTSI